MIIRKGMLVAGLTVALAMGACGTDDDDDTATATPTATATQAGSGTVAITFRIDTTQMADGTNAMATVESGEQVFIVGDFVGGCNYDDDPDQLCWKPQSPNRVMSDEGGGLYAITIDLVPGTVLNYKYTKTTDDSADEWGNGMKDYKEVTAGECNGYPDATQAFYELNLGYTVPDADATVDTYAVEAWRDYAEALTGYPSCQ